MNKKIGRISDAEMEIMQLIWGKGEPISTVEIMEGLPKENSWKQTTVLTLAKRLMEKGIIQGEKRGKSSYYSPKLSEEEYKGIQSREFLEEMHGGSVKNLLVALCGSKKIKQEELDELKQWFKEE